MTIKSINLSNLCENISRRYDFANHNEVIFINTGDVYNGEILHNHYSKTTELPGQAKKGIKKNDILISEIRPRNKRFAYVTDHADDYVVSTKFMVLQCKDDINSKFIYHYLTSEDLLNIFQKEAEARSGTFPQITFDSIAHLKIKLPPKNEQDKITNFLDLIDEKIQLNKKINKTHEEFIQTIFKSWFVDFDPVRAKIEKKSTGLSKNLEDLFSDHFENSDLGEVPKNWKVELFESVVDKYIDNRGKTPPLSINGIPLIEVKHFDKNSPFPNLRTDKYVSQETFTTWFRDHIKKNDILISTVGSVGLTSFVFDENLAIAQNVLGLRFSKKFMSLYMFCLLKNTYFQRQISSRLVETVQKSIKRKDLNKIPILVPPKEICEKFAEIIIVHLEQQFNNEIQNTVLANLKKILQKELVLGKLRFTYNKIT